MNAKLDEGVRVFDRFIAERGLKSTWQRNAILTAFFELRGHITVEELWAKVRLVDDRVSVATVYRTMKLLAESGLVHVRDFGDGQARYEAAVGRQNHDHLICTNCQKIVEFEREELDRLQASIADQHRFHVTSRKLLLYGLCEGCSA